MPNRRTLFQVGAVAAIVPVVGCQETADDSIETDQSTGDDAAAESSAGENDGSGGGDESVAENSVDSDSQDGTRLCVVRSTGRTTDDSEVDVVRFVVKSGSSEPVNVRQMTAEWSGPSGTYELRPIGGYDWRSADGAFEFNAVINTDDDAGNVGPDERAQLVSTLGDSERNGSFGSELPPGSQVAVTFRNRDAGEIPVSFVIPDTLRANDNIVLCACSAYSDTRSKPTALIVRGGRCGPNSRHGPNRAEASIDHVYMPPNSCYRATAPKTMSCRYRPATLSVVGNLPFEPRLSKINGTPSKQASTSPVSYTSTGHRLTRYTRQSSPVSQKSTGHPLISPPRIPSASQ